MRRPATRLLLVGLLLAAVQLGAAPDARADAAGPTDYNTEIVSIEPPTDQIRVEMIGGDSFFGLEQLEPIEIIVIGYQGEPYLRFDPSGVVFENRRSPSLWLNQERYGTEEVPEFADADAAPQWAPVAENGRYAWHDHRSHWMNPQRPPGAAAGDQVLEATVPLRIDGRSVTVTVASYLLPDPSPWPALAGGGFGLAVGALAVRRTERLSRAAVSAGTALVAGIVGLVAFGSVPPETEPSRLLWVLPAVALVAAVVLAVVRNLTSTTVYLDGLAVAAGGSLAWWSIFRFDALRRALIPTDTPAGLDRFVIVVALVVGAVLALQGVLGLLRPQLLLAEDAT